MIPAAFGYQTAGCDQEIPSTDSDVIGQNSCTGKNSLVWNGKSRRMWKGHASNGQTSFGFKRYTTPMMANETTKLCVMLSIAYTQ